MRACIGLTKPQAVSNLKYQEAAKAAYLKQHPAAKQATLGKIGAEAGARYAARQHRYRAKCIARTELAFGWNAGAYGATKDAQAQGYIGECKKKWLTAYDDRVCPVCSVMDEETADMDAMFSNGKLLPPGHPQCRCAVAYDEVAKPAASTQPGAFDSGIDLGRSLEGYTDTQKKEMEQLLGNSQQEIQAAFSKYGGQFQEVDSHIKPGLKAYFDLSDGRVHMNRKVAAAGSDWEAKYQMHFHEYAHNLDFIHGNGKNASALWQDSVGNTFEDIIENDWKQSLRDFFTSDPGHGYSQKLELQFGYGGMGGEAFISDMIANWRQLNGYSRRDPAVVGLKDELRTLDGTNESYRKYWKKHFDTFKDMVYDNFVDKKDVVDDFISDIKNRLSFKSRSDISDMFEPYVTKNFGKKYSYPFGFGHGWEYAMRKGAITKEAFAEMTSASITNPESLEQIKKYLPNAYKAYLDMLRGMI